MKAYRAHSDVTYVGWLVGCLSFRPASVAILLPITHLSRRDCLILRNSSECFPLDKENPLRNLMQTVPALYAFLTDDERTQACLFMAHVTAASSDGKCQRIG